MLMRIVICPINITAHVKYIPSHFFFLRQIRSISASLFSAIYDSPALRTLVDHSLWPKEHFRLCFRNDYSQY